MTRPILVFGAGGRVGGELTKLSGRLLCPSAEAVDITRADRVAEIARHAGLAFGGDGIAAIINLAACTLPTAEQSGDGLEATQVNTDAVRGIADCAAKAGVPLIHLSTDCVFDGTKLVAYDPSDEMQPVNWYGASKAGGERAIALAGCAHIIIRTTGVYLADKPNFLKLVLDKARAGEDLTVVSDSIYTPTDARELAKAILVATERVIADPSVSGTYHFAGPDVMSYMDFADLVLEEAGLSMPIHATTMAEREKIEGFKRPKNAALNSDLFAETFGLRHRPTRECVRELVKPR